MVYARSNGQLSVWQQAETLCKQTASELSHIALIIEPHCSYNHCLWELQFECVQTIETLRVHWLKYKIIYTHYHSVAPSYSCPLHSTCYTGQEEGVHICTYFTAQSLSAFNQVITEPQEPKKICIVEAPMLVKLTYVSLHYSCDLVSSRLSS